MVLRWGNYNIIGRWQREEESWWDAADVWSGGLSLGKGWGGISWEVLEEGRNEGGWRRGEAVTRGSLNNFSFRKMQ